jgi:thiol-disulfide isomerase/thioredoxin
MGAAAPEATCQSGVIMSFKHFAIAALLWTGLLAPAIAGDTGKPAAPLTATLFDGSTFSLEQQKGHVVLVNYWASWCGPCKQELPVFARYYQAHHGEGFELLAINVDDPDTLDAARTMAKSFPFPVTRAVDIKTDAYARSCQPSKGIMSLFSICRLPHTYLIDRNGVVQLDVTEGLDEARLDQTVGPLLAGGR